MLKDRSFLLEHCAPAIPTVHVGVIGLGHRGLKAVERYGLVPGAEIIALADHKASSVERANKLLASAGRAQAAAYSGQEAHVCLMANADIDLVYICTDWTNHAQLAQMAMLSGKHVAVEVPMAMSVAECEMLIDTSLQTGRHCIMLENCCYDTFASSTRVMAERGLLGDITHCEGAYLHDLSDEVNERGGMEGYWMARLTMEQPGNAYPTHPMGTIALLLNLHRGDKMDYLVSMTSKGEGLQGRVNNTLIHTHLGRTILLQHDIGTPRPYSRLQTVCGTKGFSQKYPIPTLCLDGMKAPVQGEEALSISNDYREQGICEWIDNGEAHNSPNVMNHVMDCRLIYCLRNGLPLDMDIYDAAEWSAIIELSNRSVMCGSKPVEFPDFTRGNWNKLACHRFY